MRTLDGLDVQVANAIVLADGGVARVGQRAGALVAEARHIVFVPEKAKRRTACTPLKPTNQNSAKSGAAQIYSLHGDRDGGRMYCGTTAIYSSTAVVSKQHLPAESLLLGNLALEGAELIVHHLPDNVIALPETKKNKTRTRQAGRAKHHTRMNVRSK